ncbi:site-specific integrase [uncultured Fusobacterium sp.]|uniref:tyrosine-type recombinase/integrase n=1 Tax=uncultured Fusobacterium sp. TaxID=159267 RepID=UPI0025F5CC05|nr:site-specific integrase [uncultured Fusobacterium sp.]
MKNENGAGNIYKLKGKRRKPWVIRITTGYTVDGKQVRKVVGTYETKRIAQEALFEYLKNPRLYSKTTFKDVRELWWNTYIIDKSHRTIETNKFRMKFFESLDNREIAEIKLFELQNLFDNMNRSWSFKISCKSILNMIFDYALKNDFISSNKISFVEVGKKIKILERKIFTKEEIGILWKNINSAEEYCQYIYIVLILLYTGMRIGELQNLKNEDIDLENRIIKIKASKTEAGVRVIPISSKIYDLVKKHVNLEQEYFVKGDTTLKLSYSTFKPRFQKLLKKLGIQEHTIHDTRHTFATMLNNADANSTTITKLIGHVNFNTTENIYTHKDTDELRKAIELLN